MEEGPFQPTFWQVRRSQILQGLKGIGALISLK